MKNGKRPTRRQKKVIQDSNLKVEEWLVCKATYDSLELVNKKTDDVINIRY